MNMPLRLVTLQVVDTGLDENYLNGGEMRIAGGADFTGNPQGVFEWNDCNGHGT